MALTTATEFIAAGADAVKLEGADVVAIRALTRKGICVMGHVGLEPQHATSMGGLRLQGTTAVGARKVVADAKKVVEAGAFAVVVECVPADVGRAVQEALDAQYGNIPVIGIGAGPDTAGQVLVWDDVVGLSPSNPSFAKKYGNVREVALDACRAFVDDVRNGNFPIRGEHCRDLHPREAVEFAKPSGLAAPPKPASTTPSARPRRTTSW